MYIDPEANYDVFSSSMIEGEQDHFSSSIFEIDELIAPAIIHLNRKGYQTRFCCAGHPFPDRVGIVIHNEDEDDGVVYHYSNPMEAYILFENEIKFPFLPRCWICETMLTVDEENEEPTIPRTRIFLPLNYDPNIWGFYRMLIYEMQLLDQWAEALPPIR